MALAKNITKHQDSILDKEAYDNDVTLKIGDVIETATRSVSVSHLEMRLAKIPTSLTFTLELAYAYYVVYNNQKACLCL